VARSAAPSKKPAVAKATPAPRPAANVGPARRMQAALASAVNADDWKEF